MLYALIRSPQATPTSRVMHSLLQVLKVRNRLDSHKKHATETKGSIEEVQDPLPQMLLPVLPLDFFTSNDDIIQIHRQNGDMDSSMPVLYDLHYTFSSPYHKQLS